MRELLTIYIEFLKMGAVTFGGGYAMLPILRRTCVQARGWVTEEEIMDFYALSQGLPGIIAVNVAVFIGNKLRGFRGGIAAVLGVVTPCIVIISIIALLLSNFRDNTYVRWAMTGISVCVAALIVDAVQALWKKGVKNAVGFAICAGVFWLTMFTKTSPVFVIIGAAALGVVLGLAGGKGGKAA